MASNFYKNYSEYLGANRCCNIKTKGNPGEQGPTGMSAIGAKGDKGDTGYTGPTGRSCKGDTGPTGPKSFIIDHPLYPEKKWLRFGCLEGPEAGIYFRGTGTTVDGSATIELPNYTEALGYNFTVTISLICDEENIYDRYNYPQLCASKVKDNKFTVYSTESCQFTWLVFGQRFLDFEIEPNKEDVEVKGDGPYRYI